MIYKPTARLLWDSRNDSEASTIATFTDIELVCPNLFTQNNNLNFNTFHRRINKANVFNRILKGDNMQVMQTLIDNGWEEMIDLIYIDPPYLSDTDYKSKIRLGKELQQQPIERRAFKDTWEHGIDSYLDMLYPRLKLMKKMLTKNGSIFIHLDWHVSHYVKILLDELFSMDHLVNEIIWCYTGGTGTKRHFHRKHDVILWYVKDNDYIFNPQFRPYTSGTIERGLTKVKGDKYKLHNQGAMMQDWWTDINKILSPTARENLKFPTQKPAALLNRIISAASNPDSIVADFFCGSGTIAEVCNELGRKWIISDHSELAIQTSIYRLIKNNSLPFKVKSMLKQNWNDGNLTVETPVIEEYDDQTVLIKIGIKNYYPIGAAGKVEDFSVYIEYWAVDLDFQGVFHSDYQIMRENNRFEGNLNLSLVTRIARQNKYKLAIKVYDLFCNQVLKIMEI